MCKKCKHGGNKIKKVVTNKHTFPVAVPIIPEFLYQIRHQHDRFTTPKITTTTTTTPQTPFGFNETYYPDPAAPLDFIGIFQGLFREDEKNVKKSNNFKMMITQI